MQAYRGGEERLPLLTWPGMPPVPAPPPVRCGPHLLTFGRKTYIMGIVNLTTESFTGDGLDRNVEAAVARAEELVRQGAHILDLGAEASERREKGEWVPATEEIDRLRPVIRRLRQRVDVPLSVDTWKAEVAEAVLAEGAHIINDVSALSDPQMGEVVARRGAAIVLMHAQADTQYEDLVSDVLRFLQDALNRAVAAGIPAEQVILDAGFGFGKSVHQDLEMMRQLWQVRRLGRPILHAPSRKRTIGRVLGLPRDIPGRLPGTAAAVCLGVVAGADIVRVHDVLEMARLCRFTDAVLRGYDGPDE